MKQQPTEAQDAAHFEASFEAFPDHHRAGVYRAIEQRRDIRNFRPDAVPDALLWRVLQAAHCAPSVGLMQPWSFTLIFDRQLRRQVYDHFVDVNTRAAAQYSGDRAASYRSLKLQGILDAPVNVLVTCDRDRVKGPVLGRFTMPHMDEYSTCLAVQNLWLAARAEGLGVGWMSLMEPDVVATLFALPPPVVPVAYLALGYPVSFPKQPLLQQTGWRERLPLEGLVYEDRYGQPATSLKPAAAAPCGGPADPERTGGDHSAQAKERQRQLTKPEGSLGRLEELALRLAELQGAEYPRLSAPALLLFAADHGVAAEGVSAYLPSATSQMVYQFLSGGAAVNVLCRQHSVRLQVVDVGVDHDFRQATGLAHRKIRRGSRNLRHEPAMTIEEMTLALKVGRDSVDDCTEAEALALGEMGIANTTASAALLAWLIGATADSVVGRGTGIAEPTLERKRQVVDEALLRHRCQSVDSALQCLGGLEIAALVGAIERAAECRKLIVLDGFITAVAALIAVRRTPSVASCLLASHVGAELGHTRALAELGLTPLFDLGLRLGEGTGAVMGLSCVQSAVRLMREMRTFEEANIERPLDPRNAAQPGDAHRGSRST